MQVKKLNSKGNERYKDLVKTLIQSKLDEKDYVPIKELIEDNRYTEPLENGGDISPKKFSTRLDMGKYLGEILSDCKISKIEMDENLWHWLSGYFIKQILTKSSGKENIRYIWNRRNRASRRFLVRTAWQSYYINGENSKFFLNSPPWQHSNEAETYLSREELFRNPVIAKLCVDLYWDATRDRVLENSTDHRDKKNPRAGILYPRLYKKILEISKIYDLWSIDVDEIRKLIGDEFDVWDEKRKESSKKINAKGKNPNWSRNEQIIVLKHYFEARDPIELSKDNKKMKKLSAILKNLDEHHDSKKQDNFRSAEGVRRKILNFCAIDPNIEDGEGLENHSAADQKIFFEFSNDKKKIKELLSMYELIVKQKKKDE